MQGQAKIELSIKFCTGTWAPKESEGRRALYYGTSNKNSYTLYIETEGVTSKKEKFIKPFILVFQIATLNDKTSIY